MKWASLLLVAALSACGLTSNKKMMDSWLGHHKDELMNKWGAPTRVYSDNGKTILVYEENKTYTTSNSQVYPQSNGSMRYNSAQQSYTRTYQFFIDRNGYIYSWVTK